MSLDESLIFVRVVEQESFSAAGRALGLPKSTVSRKVSQLEERLGVRLLQRTTRKLSLTDAGRIYFAHAARAAAAMEEAELAVSRLEERPRGLLRVTAPLSFGFVGPIVAGFLKEHPAVRVELMATDRIVDLVEEGFDVAIRAGRLADSTLIARKIGLLPRYLVAAPSYLRKRGTPKDPDALAEHDCVLFGARLERQTWTLWSGDVRRDVEVTARLTANDLDMLREAAVAGLGVASIPVDRCTRDLEERRLRRILKGWRAEATPVHALYPSTRHLSPKVSAFLDALSARMPRWDRISAGAG